MLIAHRRCSTLAHTLQMALVAAQDSEMEDLEINLSSQRLVEVPSHVVLRLNLHFLDLSSNDISSLPDSICNLTSLFVPLVFVFS